MPKVQAAGGGGMTRGRRGRMVAATELAEINVVPLVDVMLVLLVIFMVAAPMMQQGVNVQLPQSRQASAISAPVTVSIPATFGRDHRVRIGSDVVTLEALPERIKQALLGQSQQGVVLAGDGKISYQELSTVIGQLYAGGVRNIGMQFQPPSGR